ncbi:hypothetical protein DFH07DRAFT_844832 [Mycena maculata]|uniref:Uncharacterized protein n=1 Tax=Mycena maculata TaxID=230809 RepID=A0AAD7I5L1_9AGAR|nr:hypothetical protein DFH07DRAFT_844832 [Mycena maculata]
MNGHMECFWSSEPLYNLATIIGDPGLCLCLFSCLNSVALSSGPCTGDVGHLSDGTYLINPNLLAAVHYGLPFTIPLAALQEISFPLPLLLGYPENEWIQQRYPSGEAALLQGHNYCLFARTGMAWLVECIRRCIICGEDSLINFGSVFGISLRDFVEQAGDFLVPIGMELHHIQVGNFMQYPSLDHEMAHLICPELTHIAIYCDRFTCALAVLPFRVQNSEGTLSVSPMDQLLASIFRLQSAWIIFFHDGAEKSVMAEHDKNTISLSTSPSSSASSSRASSVNPSSSSSSPASSSDDSSYFYCTEG